MLCFQVSWTENWRSNFTEDDKHVYKLFLNSQSHLPTEMLQTASNFSVSAGETGQKSVDNAKKCCSGRNQRVSPWEVQITVTQVWFARLLSYYSRKTHSYKQGIMYKCIYCTSNFVVDNLTATKKPPNLGVCCTCHSHTLNSKCSLMICWQLTCSRFAISLKSSTSPAWKTTMFSLGQQNRANTAFIFHPNPSWDRHGSHSKAQVLSATRLEMSFAL